MTEQSVLVHREDDISVVTLNRPESLNSFDPSMTPALDAALSEADADPDTRAIIVTGAGRRFPPAVTSVPSARIPIAASTGAAGISRRPCCASRSRRLRW